MGSGAARDYSWKYHMNEKCEMRNGGTAHKNQKRRRGLEPAVFSYRKPKETLIKSQSQILQEFLYIASS